MSTERKSMEPIAFQFSITKQEVQTLFYENEPWFVAKDVCDILGLSNVTRALSNLDDDEKLTLPIVRAGQTREANIVNESGVYQLIFKSRKPEAKTFRKWVTKEVLPSIRKNGYYGNTHRTDDFIDARDVPPSFQSLNDYSVCTVAIKNDHWYSVNDVHRAIHSATPAGQTVKKLNAKRTLAIKIYVYGGTHPAWFTNKTGVELIISGSRILKQTNQLKLGI
tara:strand:+ start:11610 stop:12275 length:666 start_codon:yes stop_codon:yes gene_type:complete